MGLIDAVSSLGSKISASMMYRARTAEHRARDLGGESWVVKAQIHSGGRGKAGGVKICSSDEKIQSAASSMLGARMVTAQTGERGTLVYRLYVEEAMQIEEISVERPDSIVRATIVPAVGLVGYQARELAFKLGLEPWLVQQFVQTLAGCHQAFTDYDATIVEINPLIVKSERNIVAPDAKMTFDASALFHHPRIAELRDKSQEDPRESLAADRRLS